MNLRFAAIVIVVLFVGAPSLESIGARAQSACEEGCSAAEPNGDPEVIRRLIQQGNDLCNCNCTGASEQGILHVAARSGCVLCFDLLTSNPGSCPCDVEDNNGNTPLHIAARGCFGPTTSQAIRASCDVDAVNNAGNTPLCEVARARTGPECGQVARTLVAAGADPCIDCGDGQTPCEGCVNQGVCDVLEDDGACNCPP